ncbi:MAG: hypothetical protein QOH31_2988 [Verrucomicrobiota bacterium]|jgi:hypothetical protein
MIGIIQRAPTGRGVSGFGADSSCENRDIPRLEGASTLACASVLYRHSGTSFPRL